MKRFLNLTAVFLLLISSLHAYSAPSQPNTAPKTTPHIQILAASCAACHGTRGNSVTDTAVLAGIDKVHFIKQMLMFKSGERKSTVMKRHAQGLSTDEISALGEYYSTQKPVAASMPSKPTN